MPNQSYVQTNFSGGEWSPPFQGRLDDREYQTALKQCLNYIPNQEGTLSTRGGFRRCGNTKVNSRAKLIPFRLRSYEDYVAEFSGVNDGGDSDNLRLWSNGLPVFSKDTASFVSVSGDPPTFVIQDDSVAGSGLVPSTWSDGDSIMIHIETAAGVAAAGNLCNREFTITIVDASAGTITLTDAVTQTDLTGTVSASLTLASFRKIVDITTYYDYPQSVRSIEYASQVATVNPGTADVQFSGIDHRVSFLYPLASPKSFSDRQHYVDELNVKFDFELQKEKFIDGPYLDSTSTTEPATVSGTTGSITVTLHKWNATTNYVKGQVVWDGTNHFVSVANDNLNQALPSTNSAGTYWAALPLAWDSGTTYDIGQPATSSPTSTTNVPTVYYSVQASNTNHAPTDASWWSTTPPAYAGGTTYADYAVVVSSGIKYVSIQGSNTGHTPASSPTWWLPIDFETGIDTINNRLTGWQAYHAVFYTNDPGNNSLDNIPRLIRIKASPQPWNVNTTYATGDLVNFHDNIYKSLANSNVGNFPDQDAVNWEIQSQTILWTWGEITAVADTYTATVTLKGQDLPNSHPIYEWRFGVFGDSTSWPAGGCFHEGRIWLFAPESNSIYAGVANQGFNFAPTAPDGTVADNNAISYTLNAAEQESIRSMATLAEGVQVFTSESEWLIAASSLNDPITPTSIQAHRTTSFSAADAEVTRLPSSIAVVQDGGRRILEYRNFIDMSSYQSRLNTVDLTRKCQHLTGQGVLLTQYQNIPQPVLWAITGADAGIVQSGSPPATNVHPIAFLKISKGKLFGEGYARTPDVSYTAPFSFEHGLAYANPSNNYYTNGIAVQRGSDAKAEYLYATIASDADGYTYMEMMTPPFETSPLDDTYNTDNTVNTFGSLSKVCLLDSAVVPAGAKIAADGLSVTFYGIWPHAGNTVSFCCRGVYVGDYAIGSDGSVTVAFDSTKFAKTDLGRAMYTIPNALYTPASFQSFYLNKNGITGVDEPSTITTGFLGYFGYAFRRRGQQLRPPVNGQNGPSFAKERQNHKMGVYTDCAQQMKIGYSFDNLHPLTLTSGESVTAVTGRTTATGIFRDDVEDRDSFDGNLCWEQTNPSPGNVLAVGGFLEVVDV